MSQPTKEEIERAEEIARLQEAIADERSKENVALRAALADLVAAATAEVNE